MSYIFLRMYCHLHTNLISFPLPLTCFLQARNPQKRGAELGGVLSSSKKPPPALGRRFNESAFRGNDDLYGFPLRNGRKGLSVWGIVGVGLASGVLSLVVSFAVVCVWLRVTERRNGGGDDGGKIAHYMSDY